ncbi:glycosyltransferase family 2 protein [Mesorhizobium microcysteis]|uniref:Glycosyltransferase family 2 protein n=1 Tax=Neoaquamicrobium microcysteis TaxID=2682781 RepID=A0A5D4GTJ5_9HYPH|nr:glycosyltransferase family 2 protein [Mesorhizobium microcysteis]TYR30595.1 glycosyltransferase family 2 protein [Mesorhizobium microcysteis]
MDSDGSPIQIDVCVCTFRRAELEATLRSLAAMNVPDRYRMRVIVADNDDVRSAEQLVRRLADELRLPFHYIHCPARNISIARNACLDAADADFVAFIDDDETATPEWVAQLIDEADATDASVILGPVSVHYAPDAPRWMREGDFHSTRPVWVAGKIRTGYTCNVLLRMDDTSIRGRRFSLARGQTGGEDTEFFAGVVDAGGSIAYAPDALVEERVPAARATMSWLVRRRFRFGQTHGALLRSRQPAASMPVQVTIAAAKFFYCLAATALTAPSPVRRNTNLLRGILHAGTVSGLAGLRELRQYGGPTVARAEGQST